MKSLFAVILFSILFISCSNVAEVEAVPEKKATLKSVVLDKENNVTWSKELEGERLSQNIYSDDDHISSYYFISPENVIVSHKKDPAVYPELIGFGSLDTSKTPSNIMYLVNSFCKELSEDFEQGGKQYFDSSYYFNYVFFKNDIKKSWKDKFGVDFPTVSDKEKASDDDKAGTDGAATDEAAPEVSTADGQDSKNAASEAGSEESAKEAKKTESKKPKLFTKWIIGKAFTADEITQVPVRFCCQQGYVDVTLYINMEKNKIFQIVEGTYAGKK